MAELTAAAPALEPPALLKTKGKGEANVDKKDDASQVNKDQQEPAKKPTLAAYPSSITSFSAHNVKGQAQTTHNSPRQTPKTERHPLRLEQQASIEKEEGGCAILSMCESAAFGCEKVTRDPQVIKPASAMARKP